MYRFFIVLRFSMAISATNCTDLTGLDVFWTGNHYSFTTVSSRYGLDSPREEGIEALNIAILLLADNEDELLRRSA